MSDKEKIIELTEESKIGNPAAYEIYEKHLRESRRAYKKLEEKVDGQDVVDMEV